MAKVKVYKNGILELSAGFESDYEHFKKVNGHYSIIGLMMKLIEDNPNLSHKFHQQQNFIVDKEEKNIISKRIEEYIERDINNFKEAEELEKHKTYFYKGKPYKVKIKGSGSSLEKKILNGFILHYSFYDPDNSNSIEVRFDE